MIKSDKAVKISLIVIILSWVLGSNIVLAGNPALISQSRISQNITWEFENITEDNYTLIIFDLQCEIWTNNPFPLLDSYTGDYLRPRTEYLIENETFLIGEPVTNTIWPIMPIPHFSMPGNQIFSERVGIRIDSRNITELPNGIYHFWVEFNKGGSEGIIQYYKTYMNVTESGIIITSDETPDTWGEFLSSSLILLGLLTGIPAILYITLELPVFRKLGDKSILNDKPEIKIFVKKRNIGVCIGPIIGFSLGCWLLYWPYGPIISAITAAIIERVIKHYKINKTYPTREIFRNGVVIGICIGLIIGLINVWQWDPFFMFVRFITAVLLGGISGGMIGLFIGKFKTKKSLIN